MQSADHEGNEFTKLAVRHPVGYALGSGGVVAVLLLVVFRLHPAISLGVGAFLALINWVVWRPGGIARRREGEVGNEPVNSRGIVKFVVVTVVLTGLVVLAYWLVE
jgi:hypothetical protein